MNTQFPRPRMTPSASDPVEHRFMHVPSTGAPLPEAMPPQRHAHRDRSYGIGYGNSSGYACERHFVDGHVDPMFCCK